MPILTKPTDRTISSLNPTERTDYTIAGEKGLMLRVEASGRKTWAFRYRPIGSDDRKRFPLGEHPDVSLSQARDRAADARDKVRLGHDPAAERDTLRDQRKQHENEDALTFNLLCDKFEAHLSKSKGSWQQDVGHFKRDARPQWGNKRADAITEQDCALRVEEVYQRSPVSANRFRAALAPLFKWAVKKKLLTVNPMIGIDRPHNERKAMKMNPNAKRVLNDAELLLLLRKIIGNNRMSPSVKGSLRLLALTGQRPKEMIGLQVPELWNLDDPDEAVANIPASRMKMRRPHIVPLSTQAIRVLEDQIAWVRTQDRDTGYVFPSPREHLPTVNRQALSAALRVIIDGLKPEGDDADTVRTLQANRPSTYALRRTCATGMGRLKVPREDRKAVLAHAEDDTFADHYDAYDRLDEKRIALQKWGDHVEALLTGTKSTGNVIPMRRARAGQRARPA